MAALFAFRIWFHLAGEFAEARAFVLDAESVEDAALAFAERDDTDGCIVDRIENLDAPERS